MHTAAAVVVLVVVILGQAPPQVKLPRHSHQMSTKGRGTMRESA